MIKHTQTIRRLKPVKKVKFLTFNSINLIFKDDGFKIFFNNGSLEKINRQYQHQ